jgi:hypothetical protein
MNYYYDLMMWIRCAEFFGNSNFNYNNEEIKKPYSGTKNPLAAEGETSLFMTSSMTELALTSL